MKAFIETLETKDIAVLRAAEHREADRYVQGTYWNDGKGCSVGCMMKPFMGENDKDWHGAAERVHGIPRDVTFMQDRLFELQAIGPAKAWTERFYNAIPVGADLSMVIPKFMHWLLTAPDMVRKHATGDGLEAIDRVAKLYERRLKGDTVSDKEWSDAADAADAAADAARAAADAAADTARAAARAAADAARAAADAARAAADAARAARAAAYAARAARAARAAAYAAADAARAAADAARAARAAASQRMADKFIEILSHSPVETAEREAA